MKYNVLNTFKKSEWSLKINSVTRKMSIPGESTTYLLLSTKKWGKASLITSLNSNIVRALVRESVRMCKNFESQVFN